MRTGWRPAEGEEATASHILRSSGLPPELLEALLPIRSPGDATWVIERYQQGIRGLGLDYSCVLWEGVGSSSSTCGESEEIIKADQEGSFVEKALRWSGRWGHRLDEPGWPHRPCLILYRENENIMYFDEGVDLASQGFQILKRIAEHSHRMKGIVPDYLLFKGLDIGSSMAHQASVISRIRRALREAAACKSAEIYGMAAVELVEEVIPVRAPGRGFKIGRPDLIRIV